MRLIQILCFREFLYIQIFCVIFNYIILYVSRTEFRCFRCQIFPYQPILNSFPVSIARKWKPTTRPSPQYAPRARPHTVLCMRSPCTRQNRRVRAHIHPRTRVYAWRGGTSASHSLTRTLPPGCMRNEASAPFLAPFLFASLPAAGRRRSLLRPLSGPTAALRRRYRRVDGVSNSLCGSIRRGFLVQISRNCRLYLCKHPPPFPVRAYGNWTSECDTNLHT